MELANLNFYHLQHNSRCFVINFSLFSSSELKFYILPSSLNEKGDGGGIIPSEGEEGIASHFFRRGEREITLKFFFISELLSVIGTLISISSTQIFIK